MFKKALKKVSLKTWIIIGLAAVIALTLALVMIITASLSDEKRLEYELKEDGTYEVVSIKNTYRGGWFAKDTLVVPSTYKGVAVTSIKSLHLQKTKNLVISDGITSINQAAFEKSSLETIKLPGTLTKLGDNAFNQCYYLKKVEIPSGITYIPVMAFQFCINLETVTFKGNVTMINEYAFNGCEKLSSIDIPESVVEFGALSFAGCSSLTHFDISQYVEAIGEGAFDECTALVSFDVDEENVNYSSKDGILYNKAQTSIINIPMGVTSVTVPDTITQLSASAFANRTKLEHVTLSSSLTSISANVFNGCTALVYKEEGGLKYLGCTGNDYFALMGTSEATATYSINSNTVLVAARAFANCTSLVSISIPESVKSIGSNAFMSCAALTTVNIPSQVTTIESNTFNDCKSLTQITIPATITRINANAFKDCKNLANVTFQDTTADWKVGQETIEASILADAAQAAKLLTDTHLTKVWIKAA